MALTRLGPNNSTNISGINLTSQVTGTLPVANGGTALSSGFVNGGVSSPMFQDNLHHKQLENIFVKFLFMQTEVVPQ
jgi:hypothetical protein